MPALFGVPLSPNQEVPPFYARNASLFVFPLLTIYFLWKRQWNIVSGLWLALPFAAGAVLANVFPFARRSDTQVLTVLHLPIALWLAVAYHETKDARQGGLQTVYRQIMRLLRELKETRREGDTSESWMNASAAA